jgi:hypothetical protein
MLKMSIVYVAKRYLLSGCHTVNNASKQIILFAVLLHVSRVTATETEAKRVSKQFL